jgi:hypothetical protein
MIPALTVIAARRVSHCQRQKNNKEFVRKQV